MDEESKQQLHQLTKTVATLASGMREGFTELKQGQKDMREDISNMKQDIAGMKQEITGMKQDITELKQDQATIQEDIGSMKQDIAGLKQSQATMQADIAGLKQGQKEMREDIAGMKQDIAHLQDSAYNLGVNLEDLGQRTDIGFAEVRKDFGKTNTKIDGVKADIIKIRHELFLERGIRQTEVDGLGAVQDSNEAEAKQRIDMIEAFLGEDFRQFQKRAA